MNKTCATVDSTLENNDVEVKTRDAPVPVITGELGTKRFGYPVVLGTQTVWRPSSTGTQ